MGNGRYFGTLGIGGCFGSVMSNGPLGLCNEGDFEPFFHMTPGTMGLGCDLASRVAEPAVDTSADEAELKLLIQTFGPMLNKPGTQSYSHVVKKKTEYRVTEYVADRSAHFGTADPSAYVTQCRQELDADGAWLRKYVEPPMAVRKKVTDWAKAQDVFYAWVRKAYDNALGAETDVPKMIKSQMSEKLKTALEQVKHDFGKDFRYGGFNPRPMKKHGYRLGTLSDHALGTAVDIESARNPHLLAKEWKALLGFTGETADHSAASWKTAPKTVYDGIQKVNDAWVTQLAAALKAAQTQAAALPAPAAGAKPKSATALAMEAQPHLKTLGAEFMTKWAGGFFTLPWELVTALHEAGFLWGATFSDLDLHHFEL